MSQDGQPIAESVVRRAASGDRAAQEQLLAGLHDYVRKTLFRLLLGRPQDLDDLTQSALLKVLTALPSYRFESALKTWVTGICVNVVRDYLRKKTRRRWFEIPTESEPDSGTSRSVANLENQVEAREALGECAAVLENMSPSQRMAFWLRTVDGRSIEEIAEIMGSAKSTARMRVYYGRKAFKKGLRRQLAADTHWRPGQCPDSPGGE